MASPSMNHGLNHIPILFLFGSQSGNAEEIAKILCADADDKGFATKLMCTKDFSKDFNAFANEQIVIIICSTTGNGDPPDNAIRFWRKMRKTKDSKFLSGMKFAVLGLGDSNYNLFNAMGQNLFQKMKALGAEDFYELGLADDAVGLEEVVEPWREGLFPALTKAYEELVLPGGANGEASKTEEKEIGSEFDLLSHYPGLPESLKHHRLRHGMLAPSVLFLHGGQDECNSIQVCKNLAHGAQSSGVEVRVMAMRDFKVQQFATEKIIVFVVSTIGPPDAQDDISNFWRPIVKKREQDLFKGASFTIIGLGNATHIAKQLEHRLKDAGISGFCEPCYAPDISDKTESWQTSLPTAIFREHRRQLEALSGMTVSSQSFTSPEGMISGLLKVQIPQIRNHSLGSPAPLSESPLGLVDVKKPSRMPKFRPSSINLVREERQEICKIARSSDNILSSRWKHLSDEESTYAPLATVVSPASNLKLGYSPDLPFLAEIKSAKYLTKLNAKKDVLHLTIELPKEKGFVYSPGDVVGIYCANDSRLVDQILTKLGQGGDQTFRLMLSGDKPLLKRTESLREIKYPITLKNTLTFLYDITSPPKKSYLRMLAEYCTDPADKAALYNICAPVGKKKYDELLQQRPSLLDIFNSFPSCRPNLGHLFDQTPLLKPRYYSVSCSQSVNADSLDVALTIVDLPHPAITGARQTGVCSTWLNKLCYQQGLLKDYRGTSQPLVTEKLAGYQKIDGRILIPVFLRKATNFKLPDSLSTPIIMVGPGTGVSPFRGFAQHRYSQSQVREESQETRDESKENDTQEDISVGSSILFFGCRKKHNDFIYQEDLEKLVEDGAISKMHCAFSRESAEKVYVQNKMKESGQELTDLIMKEKAIIYVCGDGAKMASDVRRTVAEILEEHTSLTEQDAAAYVMDLTKQLRYVQDVWSS